MLLKEYLEKETKVRRILVTKDVARTGNLIRSFEKECGKQIENVNPLSLRTLAEELYLYHESEKGFFPEFEIIDDTAAVMLLRSVMFENLKDLSYFGDEKILTISTCSEIYQKLNLVRGCGWNGKENNVNARVKDLKFLTEKYEEALKGAKLLDYNALLSYLLVKSTSEDIRNCFSAEISYLTEDTEKFTGKEIEFLSKLTGNPVAIWEDIPDKGVIKSLVPKMHFFKGYGTFNEASYIVNDIVKNNIPLGDVCVLYTNEGQLNAIESAFDGNKIKASYVSERSLKDNMYIALARRILAWASDKFSEKALSDVYDSPALRNEYVDATSGDAVNAVGGRNYFSHVLNARARRDDGFTLGWGYERNLDFVAHEEALAADERTKKALEIHRDLLAIFGENGKLYDGSNAVKPYVIYEKLVSFIWKYQNKSGDIKEGKGALDNLKGAVALEDRKLSLLDATAYIDELLGSLKGHDDLLADSAEVAMISEWKHLDRKHVYFIGLSLKEMQESTTESPVLTDCEMEQWLNEGYKPTIENKTYLRDLNVYRTLALFKGEKFSLGYSFYETVLFNETSPSVFYRDALASCGIDLNDVTEFVYGNPASGSSGIAVSLSAKADYPIKLNTSNSSIEKLLDCPKKYYYAEIARIPDNEYIELNEGQWLDAMHYGSLFHYVAEKYVEAMFIKLATDAYAPATDDSVLLPIIKDEADKMFKAYPAPSVKQKDYEISKFTEVCKDYFNKVHESMLGEDLGWRMLMTEKRFDNQPHTVKDYLGNEYKFLFKGEIDRIDYKVDDAEQKIYLRIADYKTGKYDNKEKSVNLGMVVQHAIYKDALEDILLPEVLEKASNLEGNSDIKTYEPIITDFTYHFPKEPTNWRLVIAANDTEGLNITRLKAELTAIKNLGEYPDHIQLYEEIDKYRVCYAHLDGSLDFLYGAMTKPKAGGLKDHETSNCEYCDYRDICPSARGGKL